jgi:threonine aldolase
MQFLSDNTSAVAPEIMAALHTANQGFAEPYGADQWSVRIDAVFSAFFGAPVRVFPVISGTAANALSLATLCPPYGAVFAHEHAHIVRDECGAVEGMSGGARLMLLPGAGGRVTPDTLSEALHANPANVHTTQPSALSITQATEFGQCYRPAELTALCQRARQHNLRVHMDGARFANALAFLGCHPGDISGRAGVDVLSFGATKNGALAAEAVVFFNLDLVRDFELRRKRAGHLLSKMRYASAQLLAYIESGVWLRNATHANRLAAQIATAVPARLLLAAESNEVFLRLSAAEAATLRAQGFAFYDWGSADSGEYRFVVSWQQALADVAALVNALLALR